ncbi:MAG: DUF551 domain-containing protein [Bacteroidales bacterium]|nr:DUF551 domain-containing protein [Bacteroidales bacterium]
MTQQEQKRLLRLAQKKIVVIGISSTRFEKTYKAAFELAIKFTLANLWISVDEDLPEFSKKDDHVQISEPVLIKCANGAITRARYFTVSGEVPSEGWECIDAGFGVGSDKVTHWMPIPALPEGGAK